MVRLVTGKSLILSLTLGGAAVVICAACVADSQTSTTAQDAGAHDATTTPVDGASDDDGSSPIDAASSDGGATTDTGVDAAVPTPPPDFYWYVMDETTGTTAHDSTSNHYDITVPNITWNLGGIFDGATTCGTTNVGPAYRSSPITISAWVMSHARTDSPTTGALQPFPPNVISDDVPSVGGYSIGLNVWGTGSDVSAEGVAPCTHAGLCAANAMQNNADGGHSCTSPTSCEQGFVADTEYLVTLTVDAAADGGTGTTAEIYINGVLFDQDAADIIQPNATPPIYLGCHNMDTNYGTARFFNGRIRDVRAYTRHLGAAEVKQLHTNGPTLHAPI